MGALDSNDGHEQIEANNKTVEVDVNGELEVVEEVCHTIAIGG